MQNIKAGEPGDTYAAILIKSDFLGTGMHTSGVHINLSSTHVLVFNHYLRARLIIICEQSDFRSF